MEEQQEPIDLTNLQCQQKIRVADIVQVIHDVQKDILSKTATLSQIHSMQEQLKALEQDRQELLYRAKKDQEIIAKIEQLYLLPGKFKDFELTVLKNQNETNEQKTSLQHLLERIKTLETSNKKTDNFMKVLFNGGSIDTKSIVDAIMSIVKELQMSMVHRDEFMDVRAETGTLFKQVNELKVFRSSTEQRSVDDHYKLYELEHFYLTQKAEFEQSKLAIHDTKVKLKYKLDMDIYEEDMNDIRDQIERKPNVGKAGNAGNANMQLEAVQ